MHHQYRIPAVQQKYLLNHVKSLWYMYTNRNCFYNSSFLLRGRLYLFKIFQKLAGRKKPLKTWEIKPCGVEILFPVHYNTNININSTALTMLDFQPSDEASQPKRRKGYTKMNVNDVPVYGPLTTLSLPGSVGEYAVMDCKIFPTMATDRLEELGPLDIWNVRICGQEAKEST